jgi:hypothetical protein
MPQPDTVSPPSSSAAPALPPSVADRYAAMRLTFGMPDWLRTHPALAITLGYLLLTVVGLAYTWALFRRFGVDVLTYADTADFLMVVAREPLVMVVVLLPVPVYMAYMALTVRISEWARRRSKRLQRSLERSDTWWWSNSPGAVFAMKALFLATYALLFVLLYSVYQANRIRSPEARTVRVELKADAARNGTREWTAPIVGTTSRFVFLYDRETRRVEALPVDVITRIVFPPRRRLGEAVEKPASALDGP